MLQEFKIISYTFFLFLFGLPLTTSSGFSFSVTSTIDISELELTAKAKTDALEKDDHSTTHKTKRDRVSTEFRNCKDMPWKGKGVKKKKLTCFMELARELESDDSEAFIACKKKNFISDKKNCFRDLARSLTPIK